MLPIKPIFVVMAAKLAIFPTDETGIPDDEEDNVSQYSNPCSPADRIIIWVASNVITKYSYTLAISTVCNGIRLKYFGPLLTINEDYVKLYEEGKGLLLNQNHIEGMTEGGHKPLILDILIHDSIPETD